MAALSTIGRPFTGVRLDRVSVERKDPEWVAALAATPAARGIAAGREGVLVDAAGTALARLPLPADVREEPILLALAGEIAVATAFFFSDRNEITAAVTIFLFPCTSLAILPALQARIVGLAGGAPNLAAASIHAAFNVANSIGAWLGGLTIAAGLGYGSPNLVAAGLALLGLGIAVVSARRDRGSQDRAATQRSIRKRAIETLPGS